MSINELDTRPLAYYLFTLMKPFGRALPRKPNTSVEVIVKVTNWMRNMTEGPVTECGRMIASRDITSVLNVHLRVTRKTPHYLYYSPD